MTTLIQDIRYGLQMLWKHPGFTLVAVVTLALGVGANTALFSVVDAVLLKKLPVKDPDQLVQFRATWDREKFGTGSYDGINQRDPATGLTNGTSFPFQTLVYLRQQERSVLSDVFAFAPIELNLNSSGEAEFVNGQFVSGNYFTTLGVPAILGRTLQDADDHPAAAPAAVISHRYWSTRFGREQGVVGRHININNVPFTIVGVTPQGFEGAGQVGSTKDVSIPLAWEPQVNGERSAMRGAGSWWIRLMGRLQPGATYEQARAMLEPAFLQSVIEHRQARQARASTALRVIDPKDYPRLGVDPGNQGEMNARRFYNKPLRLLLGVVALVLLIACANVANLLLVRASSRSREIAVRLAVGASRWRLIRQLLTESVLLGLVGGAFGTLFATWIKEGLLAVTDWSGKEMVGLNPQLDLRVLGFTLALCVLTGILFGMFPAFRATKVDLTPSLKDSSKGFTVTGRSFLTKSLVVAQVSLSVLLLIGAGLLIRTLRNLQHVDAGFNANNLLLFNVDPELIGYKSDRLHDLYQRLFTRLEAVPGVQGVTCSRHALLSLGATTSSLFLPGGPVAADGTPADAGDAKIHVVRENFLQTMEIPLLLGRTLSTGDDGRSPKVAVVNQSFARQYFQTDNAIGKRFSLDPAKPGELEIVGIARDAKYTSQRDETPPTAYLPWQQNLSRMGSVTFEIRTSSDPANYVAAMREAVRQVETNLPLNNIRTQIEQANEALSLERLFAKLLTLFGVLAQLLAAIGLYGVMAYSVSRRTHEIGIRMALGATRQSVLRMVLKQGMTLTLAGVGLGLIVANVLTRYLETLTSMLFGVEPRDPATFVAIAGILAFVSLVACLVPARRATKVDPMVALRYE